MKKFLLSLAFMSFVGAGCFAATPNHPNNLSAGTVSATSSSSSVDKLLAEYEKYVDSYVSLAKKAANGDLSAAAKYVDVLKKAKNVASQLEKMKKEMSATQAAKFAKIAAKLAKAL